VTAPGAPRVRSPLRNRNFLLLWTGGLVSDMGDWILLVALPVYVFQLTGSALIMSTVFVVELVPALIVGQLAGVLVDRWDRRRVLVWTNVLQAALLAPLVLVTTEDRMWIIYLVAGTQACLARVSMPAKAALIPSIVAPEQLTSANSLSAVADNLARLVGSPLGGIAISLFGLVGVIVLDAATFLVSAVLSAWVRPAPEPNRPPAEAPPSLVDSWADGMATIRRTPQLFAVLAIGALSQVAQGIFVVLFVVFVLQELDGTGGDVGLIRGVQAIGGMLGGLTIGALSSRFSPRALIGWGFVVFGAIALATWNAPMFTTAIGVYAGLFVLAGIPGVATMTGLLTAIQSLAPSTHLGRVFAAFDTAAGGLQAVGVLVAGALADRMGVVTILNAQGTIYVCCGLLALVALRAKAISATGRRVPATS
jgi:MFS family permease